MRASWDMDGGVVGRRRANERAAVVVVSGGGGGVSDDRAESVSHDKEESTLRQGEAVCCGKMESAKAAQQEEAAPWSLWSCC